MNYNVPGLRNSDVNHWQSHLERDYPSEFVRIEQSNWDAPNCKEWIEQIEETLLVEKNLNKVVLVGHSIGCIAIVKWFEQFQHIIKGALLVAPSDAEQENYPSYIAGFTPIPKQTLPFPSIVVGSKNDHVTSVKRTHQFAKQWGSKLIMLENAGHIESKNGFGQWPLSIELLTELNSSKDR